MFRSQSDRRHMPSISTTPSLGNYMAISSRDGLVTAPCLPGPLQPSQNTRTRLQNSLVHSQSVPSLNQIQRTDEISSALGLQTRNILEYTKPEIVGHYEDLLCDLEALTLEDSVDEGNCASMDTAISGAVSRARSSNSSIKTRSQERFDILLNTSDNLGIGAGNGRETADADEMSSIEPYGSRAHSTIELISDVEDFGGTRRSGTSRDSAAQQEKARARAFGGLFAKINRKRLRTPSRGSTYSRSQSGSPRELVRALMASGRSDNIRPPAATTSNSGTSGSIGTSGNGAPPGTNTGVITEMPELQYLVTYNLVNNFYFNLVSWSPVNNSIAIAIESKAYWWDGSSQVRDMDIQRPGMAPVACVSCSSGDAIAVGFSDGYFCVYAVSQRRAAAARQFTSAVQCVEWFPDGQSLFVGDSAGQVCLLSYDGQSVNLVSRLMGFTQQICGISLNGDCSQVAVGANENLAIVWDIDTPTDPREACRLRHTSAVKGLSFCPWAPRLLATGGGSNDRHLRFWHTGSGTLLHQLDTHRQITAVFWSAFYKQLVLTFGFSAASQHVAAAIYSYPQPALIAHASARDPLRALSATMAPDQTKLAIAANDGTVRVFGLWPARSHTLTAAPPSMAAGSYGSAVVEHVEGVDFQGPHVR